MRQVPIRVSEWQRWTETPATQRLLALESSWLSDWLVQLRGQKLLYTGIDKAPSHITKAEMRHRFCFEMPWQRQSTSFQAQVSEYRWPLADAVVDLVILQHTLDFTAKPHQVLREASRVLCSGGYIVILGFNPYSSWGISRWIRQFSKELPWSTNPVAGKRLEDWLRLLDFRMEFHGTAGLSWPFLYHDWSWLQGLDIKLAETRILPGAVQMIIARKTIAGMTQVGAVEKKFSNSFQGVVPAARIGHQ